MLEFYGRWRINYSTLQFLSYSKNYTAVVCTDCTDGTKRQQVSQHSSEKAIDLSFSNLRKKVKWNAKNVLKSIICDFQKCRTIWRTNLSLSTKVITTHKRKCCDQKFSLQPSFKGRLNLKWNLNFPPIFMTENNEKKLYLFTVRAVYSLISWRDEEKRNCFRDLAIPKVGD